MSKKLVVGILNKDREIEVCLLLQSLLRQTYQYFDIIIIDDNSNNFLNENKVIYGLIQLHKNLNHNVKIIKGKRKGPHVAGDILFNNSKEYELIYRLDDDVVLHDNCIEELVNAFIKNDKVSAVGPIYLSPYKSISEQILDIDKHPNYLDYGKIKLVDDNNIIVNGILNTMIPINLKTEYIEVEHLHSGFMYKRKDMKKIGSYFLGYSQVGFREETDVSYRLYLNGGGILISPKAIAFHYHTIGGIYIDENGLQNNIELWRNDEKIFIERFKNSFNINNKIEVKQTGKKIIDKSLISHKIHLVTVTHGNHKKLDKLVNSVFQYTNKKNLYSWAIINNDQSTESQQSFIKLAENIQNKEQINHDNNFYEKMIYKNLDKEVSVSEARNIGADLRPEETEYICFIDNDALILGKWSDDDWLDLLYKEITKELDIGAVSPIYTWFDPLKSYVLSVACLITSVKIWKQVGKFDTIFGNKEKGTWGYEDTDWSYRLQLLGYKIKNFCVKNFPFYHENITKKKKADWQEKGLIKAKELLLLKHINILERDWIY